MIYTLTMNPSIDYVVHLDGFSLGTINRSAGEEYYIGGKGINVSCVLAELGIESTALGFTAGFTGDEIECGLSRKNIYPDFIRLSGGISRINIKLKTGEESEINSQGPHISEEEFERLLQKLDSIEDGDTLVLAGSIPKSVPAVAYVMILERLIDRKVRIIVDAEKKLLLSCLMFRPFLIKPNIQELSDIFGVERIPDSEIEACAKELMKLGAENVLVSLGCDGAVLFASDGKIYRSGIIKGKVINTVGAGDSMVAGFIAGYEKTGDFGYALKTGTACANATAFSPGLADFAAIEKIMLLVGSD